MFEIDKEEFIKPIESIMRCENFKSNFARRVSNRYTSKSSIALKADAPMTLHVIDKAAEHPESPGPILRPMKVGESSPSMVTNDRPLKLHEKSPTTVTTGAPGTKCVEVTTLTMEVETLRWQLAQTETNRRMQLALLQQIVGFLSRVKEHMVSQNQNSTHSNRGPNGLALDSGRPTDLPRSRSVLHVSRNQEYSLSPVKKLSSRKMSKSITNVNGFRDVSWYESKLTLTKQNDGAQKIIEEITRLISLASTVLSTKIPDLSYSCNKDVTNDDKISQKLPSTTNGEDNYGSDKSANDNRIIAKPNECEMNLLSRDLVASNDKDINSSFNTSEKHDTDFPISEVGSKLSLVKPDEARSSPTISVESQSFKMSTHADNRDYGHVTNFIEDESGFSSMSSFQEIGIPIINIIPPTPCKDIGFAMRDLDLMDGAESKWKPGALELDKHTMQVFWV